MGSLPDSKFIVKEDGYWFVDSHDVDSSKGYVTVSAKGIANGLSNQPNDGADFGPDTYNPSYSGSGIPYTQTSGIQEAVNYLNSIKGGTVLLKRGAYPISSTIEIKAVQSLQSTYQGLTYSTYPMTITGEQTQSYNGNNNNIENIGGTTLYPTSALSSSSYLMVINPDGVTDGTYGATDNYVKNITFLCTENGVTPNIGTSSVSRYGKSIVIHNPQNGGIDHCGSIYSNGYGFEILAYDGSGGYNAHISNNFTVNSADYAIFDNCPDSRVQNNFLYVVENGALWVGAGANVGHGVIVDSNGINATETTSYNSSFIHIKGGASGALVSNTELFIGGNALTQPVIDLTGANSSTSMIINTRVFYGDVEVPPIDIGNATTLNCQINNLFFYAASTSSPLTSLVNINSSSSKFDIQMSNVQVYIGSSTIPAATSQTLANGQGLTMTNVKFYDNNYLPHDFSVTAPSIPTSGTAQQNTNPYPVNVYLYGGTVTVINYTPSGGSATQVGTSGPATVRLNPGDSITLTYSAAPTWNWVAD